MKDQLTAAQRAVVEHARGALLVSASAGSGKTRVLVERVLEKIAQGANIDDFLIVTFSNLAAAELRAKLADELTARLAADTQNRHLRSQLARLGYAQISTVHAFCAELLRTYAHLCDLPADFRVAEETQSEPLRERAAQDTIEYLYRECEKDGDLAALLDTFGNDRNDRKMTKLLLGAYDRIQAHARPMAWLNACRAELEKTDENIETTIWGQALLDDFRAMLRSKAALHDYALRLIDLHDEFAPYRAAFEDDRAEMTRLATLSWDELAQVAPSFTKLKTVGDNADEFTKDFLQKQVREKWKTAFKSWLTAFKGGRAQAMADLQKTAAPLRGLFALLAQFDHTYTQEKRRRRFLDFGDLEHEAVKLLLDENGAPTATAREVAQRFTEVLVDEYQDSNAVQDAIYRAVSRGGENLFFVGDVKQSIYGFRLADPTIFAEKYRAFDERDNMGDTPRKILLTQNFRSSPAVLDAVNFVFGALMREALGGVDYTEKEAMHSGRPDAFPDLGEPAVELHLIESGVDGEEVDDAAAPERVEIEARFVTQRIRELIEGEHVIGDGNGGTRRIRPGDIAILLRSYASTAPKILAALHDAGIPAVGRGDDDLFASAPVQTLAAFLHCIQNPRNPTALAAALLSPAGGFSADDLARLRASHGGDLYDALRAAEDAKATSFQQTLDNLREKRRWMPLSAFLDALIAELSLAEIFGASAEGETSLAQLRAYRELCLSLIARGTDDLGQLLRQLDDLREKEKRVPPTEDQPLDCVRVLTIHAAKGLEYPVVFLADLAHQFNRQDLIEPLLTDVKLMAGCNVVDTALMASYPSVAKRAIAEKKERDLFSEEMRLLYVAMTRPQQRLIMTYCCKDVEKKIATTAVLAERAVLPYVASERASGIGDWVLLAAALRPEGRQVFAYSEKAAIADAPWRIEKHDVPQKPEKRKLVVADLAPLDETCLDRSYTFSDVPAKITATQLKGRQLDRESAEGAGEIRMAQPEIRERPFMPETRALTATERGTATHLFLQYCRYADCQTAAGVAGEKQRLTDAAFLTPEQAACVDENAVASFFASELGRRLLNAPFLRREFKFSLLTSLPPSGGRCSRPEARADEGQNNQCLPPSGGRCSRPEARADEGQNTPPTLLQGVIDCFWRERGGLVVLDFKTDAVSAEGASARAETYRPQIEAYADALERIYGEPVKEKVLYFLRCGKAISL